jgi:hypothetical protein
MPHASFACSHAAARYEKVSVHFRYAAARFLDGGGDEGAGHRAEEAGGGQAMSGLEFLQRPEREFAEGGDLMAG